MAVELQIPVALARYAENQDTLKVEGRSVGETLGHLTRRYPSLKEHLFGTDGKLRQFVNIYVNDEDIRHQKNMETPLKSGDIMVIVPSIAGGLS